MVVYNKANQPGFLCILQLTETDREISICFEYNLSYIILYCIIGSAYYIFD